MIAGGNKNNKNNNKNHSIRDQTGSKLNIKNEKRMKSLRRLILNSTLHRSNHHDQERSTTTIIIIILEGILLFNQGNPLKDLFHLKIFLSIPYSLAKIRRESRGGYVTRSATDPDPDPDPNYDDGGGGDGSDRVGNGKGHGQHKGRHVNEIIDDDDDDDDDDNGNNDDDKDKEGLGFWKDPPGYFDDVVWPNYLRHHSFLFHHLLDRHQDHEHESVDREIDLDQSHLSFDENVLRREDIHLHLFPITPHRRGGGEKNDYPHNNDEDRGGGDNDDDDDDSFLESLEWSLDLILQTPLPLPLSSPTP